MDIPSDWLRDVSKYHGDMLEAGSTNIRSQWPTEWHDLGSLRYPEVGVS